MTCREWLKFHIIITLSAYWADKSPFTWHMGKVEPKYQNPITCLFQWFFTGLSLIITSQFIDSRYFKRRPLQKQPHTLVCWVMSPIIQDCVFNLFLFPCCSHQWFQTLLVHLSGEQRYKDTGPCLWTEFPDLNSDTFWKKKLWARVL